jgi:hypothetical protein
MAIAALRRYVTLVAGLWLIASSGAAPAQSEPAGRFVSVTGEVSVVASDGTQRAAARDSDFRAGETLVTGDNALAQLRMADRSLISVRGGSEFKLDQFAYAGKADSNASFVMSIVKGGFRTITGLIAQGNRRGYRITTPSATIGVRGTHFEVVHLPPQTAGQDVAPGTYNRVFEGITTMQNPAGAGILVNRDQTAFAALQGNVAPVLVAPPAAIFGRPTPVPRAKPAATSDGGGREEKARAVAPALQPQTPPTPEAVRAAPAPALTPLETAPTIRLTPLAPAPTVQPALTPLEAPATRLTPLQPAPTLQPAPALTPLEPARILTPVPAPAIAPITPITPLTPAQPAPVPAVTPIQRAPVLQPAPVLQIAPTTVTPIK